MGYAFLHDGCTPSAGPAPVWLEVLAHISLGITSFFLLEIPLTLWALGPRFYDPFGRVPHASLHLWDGFIIITTFVLEVVLRGKEQELAGLLVILRLWRLVKLVGGARKYFPSANTQPHIRQVFPSVLANSGKPTRYAPQRPKKNSRPQRRKTQTCEHVSRRQDYIKNV